MISVSLDGGHRLIPEAQLPLRECNYPSSDFRPVPKVGHFNESRSSGANIANESTPRGRLGARRLLEQDAGLDHLVVIG